MPPALKLCYKFHCQMQTSMHAVRDEHKDKAGSCVPPAESSLALLSNCIQLRACTSTVGRLLQFACIFHRDYAAAGVVWFLADAQSQCQAMTCYLLLCLKQLWQQ